VDDPTSDALVAPVALDATARAELERTTERWFVRRGLPHFISGYSASRDIFTRASGFLIVVFVLELLNALNEQFEWWQNLLALVGAIGIATLGLAGVNRLRGRRPFQRPDTIGPVELGAFVLVPAIIPYAVGGQQVAQAIDIAVGNLFILLVVFVVVGYGMVPMTRWAVVQMFQQTRNVTNLFVRSLPLLLLFTMFMFFNAEVWKIVDDLPDVFFAIAIGILVAVGSAFVLLRFPRELQAMSTFESWDDIATRVRGTPMADVATASLPEPPEAVALGRRARVNVGLVLFASQAIQILLVTAAIGAFYVAFGLFTIVPSTVEQWTGSEDLQAIARWDLGGHELVLSNELIRTAIFIAAIAGLQFTIAALTDSTYRDEFYDEITRDVRQAIAVRDLYLARVIGNDGEGGDDGRPSLATADTATQAPAPP
jgi:hypothetical protein